MKKRKRLQKKERAAEKLARKKKVDEVTAKARQDFREIRADLALIVHGYNEEGAHMLGIRDQLEFYREEINRLYPMLYGNEWFSASVCRRMEIQIAVLLEEPHPPKTALYDKVTQH